MIYGCIGEHLPHSFSKEIHEQIGDYKYELRELTPDEVGPFLERGDFRAINVTIPYKQTVIPYMYEISETASSIGAVNTIVNRDGRLYGYNTDFYGLSRLIERLGITLAGKKALILGTGGTSRTAYHVAQSMGAHTVLRVSRTAREGAISYDEAIAAHSDADVIINTTPCGMFPKIDEAPISLEPFKQLSGVVDAIYNPLRSRLVQAAQARGIPAGGGLFMLVAQGVRAAEFFRDTQYPDALMDRIYERTLRQKENVVLIGMPGSGKTTVSGLLGEMMGREVLDADTVVQQHAGMSIPEIFARYGEERFRELESEAVAQLSARSGVIIATGGGTVLRAKNVAALRQNGRICLLDRPLEALTPTDDRPLGNTREKIARLHAERMPIYLAAADEIIAVNGSAEDAAREIIKLWAAD